MKESSLYKFKICLIGESAVGKTNIIRRFVFNHFDDKYIATIGTLLTKKVLQIRSPQSGTLVNVILLVWDIMGQLDFRRLVRQEYFLGANGLIATCDVTKIDTLYALPEWMKTAQEITGEVPVVFLGNKYDLADEQEVFREDIKNLATKYSNAPVFLTSAKTGENVELAFRILSEKMLEEVH